MEENEENFNINSSQFNKDILLLIIIIIILNFSQKFNDKNKFEKYIIRYIKYKKKNNLPYKNFEKEIPLIKEYINFLKNNLTKIQIFNININKPKISFITSVYNKEKYLLSFILSIQNQFLKEFEIIMVDDFSSDNSIKKINEFQNKDKRIKLIKNNKNMGSFYSRYIGTLNSKGDYIIFVDSDDIILKGGIIKAYEHIIKNNLDMVEFHAIYERNGKNYIRRNCYKYLNIIYQPILSYIFFYKKNKGDEQNITLWDKLIRREVVLKSFNYIGEKYINEKIFHENDVLLLFALFRKSKSYQYIDEIGYYYYRTNNDSITNTKYNIKYANQMMHSIFINIKFLYENTDDTYIDKYFCIFKLTQGYKRYNKFSKYINNVELNFIENILNTLLNSKYISALNKLTIYDIKIKLLKNYLKKY